ncbi:hypothetical protein VW35_07155 [Devosia soli]|uniref:Uncharacterized protein n=1 Tax=Devosia soli TaxID=361041 RepID=A0A0F5LCW3_9HYPH|nr:tetratricopeptide repeat protein [Devosia soli]KKB80193.1 hypothetical protein VW35_07155 [Devosia soli]
MARSPQLMRFVDYIVRKTLDGDSQSIKAYSIAVDVFGRPADFDPQSDPIVRVQARRLRGLLDQYYRGPGGSDPVRIELPVGRYVPNFIALDVAQAQAETQAVSEGAIPGAPAAAGSVSPGQITVSWFVLLFITIGIGILAYSISNWGPRPASVGVTSNAIIQPNLTIMEFQSLTGDASIAAAVSGLALELVDRMRPLSFLTVGYGGRGDIPDTVAASHGYVLTGIVRRDPAEPQNVQYSVVLTDLSSNSAIWNRSLTLRQDQLADPNRIDRLSTDLMDVLGNPRGPLHIKARRFLANGSIAGSENLYLCRLLFTMYRETSTIGAAERTKDCYAALPQADQETAIALAAVASLIAETQAVGRISTSEQLERYGNAATLLSQAIRTDPTSSFAWEQRARLHETLGEHELAETAYGTSLQINPSNIDALAAHARHLAFMGNLDQAVPMAQRAIDVYSIIPDWYYGVPTLAALRTGDFAKAALYAQTYSRADRELGPILAIIAAEGMENEAQVVRELPRVLDVPAFRNAGIITQLRRRVPDNELLNRIRTALIEAGVPPLALVTAF